MYRLSVLVIFILIAFQSKAQFKKDSIDLKEKIKINPLPSSYNPKKAIIRSAILPGWGQITNKKYWKLPLVYGAIATPVVLFYQNYNQYLDAKSAYILATDNNPANDDQIKQPYYSVRSQPERIRAFRNQVRQNMDYCALFFIALWGLNVVDAAVDAHLKTFDISDDLSIQIKGGYSPAARTSGISIVVPLSK
jgi:hypothetical protein